jgi:hypothetical protein
MASYFNWWGPDFFYMPIYLDGMGAGKKPLDLFVVED